MPATECLLCLTPPARLEGLQTTLCTCGDVLGEHTLRAPHRCAACACPAFAAFLPIEPELVVCPDQLSLLAEGG
jgi:hypothetical protein